ncbi:hypothetical protein ACFSO7_01945 [Bacillus sp. CGMCC 1.16607]|uniref:hypothetical protein n=1 Tax=Bacillus sp. CGMCC 1.16607 TaxID=3351842 RepID=UPI00363B8327
MSNEQKEKILSIIFEAYERGINSESMTADVMVEELKEKIKVILEKEEVSLVKV